MHTSTHVAGDCGMHVPLRVRQVRARTRCTPLAEHWKTPKGVQKLLDTRGTMADTEGGEQAKLNLGRQGSKFSLDMCYSTVRCGATSMLSGAGLEDVEAHLRSSLGM